MFFRSQRAPRVKRGFAAALGLAAVATATCAEAGAAMPVFWVEASPGLERQAAAVRALAGEDPTPLLRLVGLASFGTPVRVVLAGERSPQAGDAPAWASGYALPAADTVVLFPARVPSYPDRTLEALLRHELAHILLSRAAGGYRVPRWFDEGTATVAAREWGIEDGARVALATIGRGPATLDEVEAAFGGDGTSAARGYAVAAALVRYLLRSAGDDAVGRILAEVRRGEPFDGAFRAVTGESLESFGAVYFRREALWNTWVPFLTSATALWMGITLLALLAIRRRRERDAALRRAWAAGDAGSTDRATGDGDPSRWN